jgi:hypothetical protein
VSAPVGADVESLCSKCGDVWHVVVAKVGDRIAKVQCKQCHGFHRYKPPPGSAAARELGPRTAAARTLGAGSTTKAARASRRHAEPPPPAVAPDLSKPVRRYAPSESYTPGERIQHTTFGTGVVESSPGAGKIQVVFPEGRRILAVAKAASTLSRPPV